MSPAVVVLSRIVAPYTDIIMTRIPPDHGAIVSKLRELGRDDAVVHFQAEWDTLRATPDGRAVIAMCGAAAEGGALLGRLTMKRRLEEHDELGWTSLAAYKSKTYLPVLLATIRYYRAQTAAFAAAVPTTPPPAVPEWPSMASLAEVAAKLQSPWHSELTPPPDEPLQGWYIAVAPAVTVVRRIVERYLPTPGFFTIH